MLCVMLCVVCCVVLCVMLCCVVLCCVLRMRIFIFTPLGGWPYRRGNSWISCHSREFLRCLERRSASGSTSLVERGFGMRWIPCVARVCKSVPKKVDVSVCRREN